MASFGWKWAALAGSAAAGCILAVLITAWLTVWWQRNQVERLAAQKESLESTLAGLQANVVMLKKKGGRIKITTCTNSEGVERLCIPVRSNQGKGGMKNMSRRSQTPRRTNNLSFPRGINRRTSHLTGDMVPMSFSTAFQIPAYGSNPRKALCLALRRWALG